MKILFLTFIAFLAVSLSPLSAQAEGELSITEIRDKYFQMKPQEIGLSKDSFQHPVWGIIMETGFADGHFTLITLADGTTSLHFSTGGGILGGGAHESVRQFAGRYLLGAQYFVAKASKVDDYPVPPDGQVTFSFLTFDGVSQISAPEKNMGVGEHEYANLFYAAHELMHELSKFEE